MVEEAPRETRLVDTRLASELTEVLRPGGRIYVKSDVEAISNEIAESLASVDALGDPVPFEKIRGRSPIENESVSKRVHIWRYSVERAGPRNRL